MSSACAAPVVLGLRTGAPSSTHVPAGDVPEGKLTELHFLAEETATQEREEVIRAAGYRYQPTARS
jgi:hypothetical protein